MSGNHSRWTIMLTLNIKELYISLLQIQ